MQALKILQFIENNRFIHIFKDILSVLFPVKCSLCSHAISYNDNGICENCRIKINLFKNNDYSLELGKNDDYEIYYDSFYSLYNYDSLIVKLIKEYKHSNRIVLSKFFASELLEMIKNIPQFDLITSVPINKKKLYKRGFDQTKKIGVQLSKYTNLPYISLLFEKKSNIDQKKLNYDGRFLNVIDHFQVQNKITIKDKSIIIFDDISTTGATLNECSRLLKKAGASTVLSVALAKVPIVDNDNFYK